MLGCDRAGTAPVAREAADLASSTGCSQAKDAEVGTRLRSETETTAAMAVPLEEMQ